MLRSDFTRRKLFTGLGVLFLGGIVFSVVRVVFATAPDPGHNFTAVAGGVVQGDLLYGSAADTLSALAKNTSATRYLSNTGTNNNPAWAQVDVSNGVTGGIPVDVQTFTSTGSNTWNKPSVGRIAFVQLWGGGGSGGRGGEGNGGGGGGGGGYVEMWVPLSSLGSSETCSVATGGAAVTTDDTDGNTGGNTTFADSGDIISGAVLTAYGGGGGCGTSTGDGGGGGGGGPTGAGSVGSSSAGVAVSGAGGGGSQNANNVVNIDPLGGPGGSTGSGTSGDGAHSYWGGGGGGRGENGASVFSGGNTIYGGSGGGGGGATSGAAAAGMSLFGGVGGVGAFNATVAGSGSQPGGGGGGSELGNSGAGGNGKCVITVY